MNIKNRYVLAAVLGVVASGVMVAQQATFHGNSAPVMTALDDVSGAPSTSIAITGSCTDDGKPDPPDAIAYQWSVASNIGTDCVVASPTSATTTVSSATSGVCELTLTCCDNVFSGETCTALFDDDTLTATIDSPFVVDRIVAAGGTVPNACFSISHQLSSSYAGNLIRIRTAGGSETNVGFTSGVLTESTITTHCSGTTCTIVTVFDQCGSARDVTNATVAEQPEIYASGAIHKIGSLPVALLVAGAGGTGNGDGWTRPDSVGITGAVSVWYAGNFTTVGTFQRTAVQIGSANAAAFSFRYLLTQATLAASNQVGSSSGAMRAFTLPVAASTFSDYLTALDAGANFTAATMHQRGAPLSQSATTAGTTTIDALMFSIGSAGANQALGVDGAFNSTIVMGYVPSSGVKTVLDNFGVTLRTLGGV